MTYREKSFGVQEVAEMNEEEMQFELDVVDEGIQPTIGYQDISVQPTL